MPSFHRGNKQIKYNSAMKILQQIWHMHHAALQNDWDPASGYWSRKATVGLSLKRVRKEKL